MICNAASSCILLAGGAFYLFDSFLVTFAYNIPQNNALASLVPLEADSVTYWAGYLSTWTFWSHVRTAAALAAAMLLIISLVY